MPPTTVMHGLRFECLKMFAFLPNILSQISVQMLKSVLKSRTTNRSVIPPKGRKLNPISLDIVSILVSHSCRERF